jgi:hypothetical protein
VHHPDAHSHFRHLVVAQTAEKTVATAVRKMKLERARRRNPDDPRIKSWEAEAEREERQRSMEPPVVTRALARLRSGLQLRNTCVAATALHPRLCSCPPNENLPSQSDLDPPLLPSYSFLRLAGCSSKLEPKPATP